MPDKAQLFVDCRCSLGEGPLWHPDRNELFWFDINNHKLFRADAGGTILCVTDLGEPAAAAAIIDDKTLLVASATALFKFDIETERMTPHLPFEADNPVTRSNDSRVCPQGSWWLGTMGRKLETGVGSVYHYRDGVLKPIRRDVSIPNATCFSPDGRIAYFADSPTRRIERVAIDAETGFPSGDWEVFIDLTDQSTVPDGAVTDTEGCLWVAEYGGGRVRRFTPDGKFDRAIEVPSPNVTCSAFGGADLKTLFITTAAQDMDDATSRRFPHAGGIFAFPLDVAGLPETPVRL